MIEKEQPIGIFDSGIGGLTVLSEVVKLMPAENIIYLADSKNIPYGSKSKEEIKKISRENSALLYKKGVKAILVACNTATSVAIEELRSFFEMPIIGMEPAIKPAVEANDNRRVLVMATPVTLRGEKFNVLLNEIDLDNSCMILPADDLASMIEKHIIRNSDHFVYSPEIEEHLRKFFLGVDFSAVSSIVLGCTHYVFLLPYLKKIVPDGISIIDGNLGTAKNLFNILKQLNLLNEDGKGKIEYYSTDESITNIRDVCEGVMDNYIGQNHL
ncbi:MAG TPA: glutamate racemase [Patescibacteria group bacterium]|nr:glutamate racemase [Patescibacteria group bacterium]